METHDSPILAQAVLAELGLLLSQGDTSNIAAKILSSIGSERAPSTANIKKGIFRLEFELMTNESKLVILELLEGFLLVFVGYNARGIDHSWTEEPGVEVIASVVVVSNLGLVLSRGMDKDIGDELGEDLVEELPGHLESSPVVLGFECLKDVV